MFLLAGRSKRRAQYRTQQNAQSNILEGGTKYCTQSNADPDVQD